MYKLISVQAIKFEFARKALTEIFQVQDKLSYLPTHKHMYTVFYQLKAAPQIVAALG